MEINAAVWNRLQCLSCEHARQMWPAQRISKHRVYVPEVIQENVEILGRGDTEEMMARAHWYITFYPQVFDACSRNGWKVS